jgi:hypothetical protein
MIFLGSGRGELRVREEFDYLDGNWNTILRSHITIA